jgi:hypothetical protein
MKYAQDLGFEAVGFTGRADNHLKLRHRETGTMTTISSSPRSPEIARKNAEQQLRRIAKGATR